jgi:hypothetical protein
MKLDIPEGSELVVPVALYSDGKWVRIIRYTDDRPRTEFFAVFENGRFIAGFTEQHEAYEVYTPNKLLTIGWLLDPI